jgi:hypothetical protein
MNSPPLPQEGSRTFDRAGLLPPLRERPPFNQPIFAERKTHLLDEDEEAVAGKQVNDYRFDAASEMHALYPYTSNTVQKCLDLRECRP